MAALLKPIVAPLIMSHHHAIATGAVGAVAAGAASAHIQKPITSGIMGGLIQKPGFEIEIITHQAAKPQPETIFVRPEVEIDLNLHHPHPPPIVIPSVPQHPSKF